MRSRKKKPMRLLSKKKRWAVCFPRPKKRYTNILWSKWGRECNYKQVSLLKKTQNVSKKSRMNVSITETRNFPHLFVTCLFVSLISQSKKSSIFSGANLFKTLKNYAYRNCLAELKLPKMIWKILKCDHTKQNVFKIRSIKNPTQVWTGHDNLKKIIWNKLEKW